MGTKNKNWWQRYKYTLSGLLLILPVWYIYDSLNPEFPPLWPAKHVGHFEISPMPFDLKQPYSHHDEYVKDFLFIFSQGNPDDIRQSYVNIGASALSLEDLADHDEGILHGSRHGQHAHAIAPPSISADDKLWLTIETWDGERLSVNWEIPAELISRR